MFEEGSPNLQTYPFSLNVITDQDKFLYMHTIDERLYDTKNLCVAIYNKRECVPSL